VGEWHFRRDRRDPTLIADEHWCMTPYYVDRHEYAKAPRHHLRGVNVTETDFVDGPLEDWIPGALRLDGRRQYCVLPQAELSKPYTYRLNWRTPETKTVTREDRYTPDIHTSNLLIEAYVKVGGGSHGVVLSKTDGTGYAVSVTPAGRPELLIRSRGREVIRGVAEPRVNDGQWHHLLVEIERGKADGLRWYIDGHPVEADVHGRVPGKAVSLRNEADLTVGGRADGDFLACELEFLRIAQGTLEGARTSIEELYAWQFNGPFLRDFCGNEPVGRRDAGAIEFIEP
jgi:hypothetical protein